MRSFLVNLPIDYYILFQNGYQNAQKDFDKTNFVYMQNVPLLSKKKTFYTKNEPVKTILFEDIYRCVDRKEAEQILLDAYAEEELIRHH